MTLTGVRTLPSLLMRNIGNPSGQKEVGEKLLFYFLTIHCFWRIMGDFCMDEI